MDDENPQVRIDAIVKERDRLVDERKEWLNTLQAQLGELPCCCAASGSFIWAPAGVLQHTRPKRFTGALPVYG